VNRRPDALCPSSPCQPGATLLGIVLSDGRVAFSATRIEVSEEFVRIARQGRSPEKRFRFSSRCLQDGCSQWGAGRCGVIDTVVQDVGGPRPGHDPLPDCLIRPECRWFLQRGAEACGVCPDVVTDSLEEAPTSPCD
jgi:hypothetical protein